MKNIEIKENLDEETRAGTISIYGEVYDQHIKDNMAYIVKYGFGNEKEVYAVMSLDFYNFMVHGIKK